MQARSAGIRGDIIFPHCASLYAGYLLIPRYFPWISGAGPPGRARRFFPRGGGVFCLVGLGVFLPAARGGGKKKGRLGGGGGGREARKPGEALTNPDCA